MDINSIKYDFAIQTPVPKFVGCNAWGDWHFAVGLANAIKRLGHNVDVRPCSHWFERKSDDEIDLVIRGMRKFPVEKSDFCIYWIISNTNSITLDEIETVDVIFCASPKLMYRIAEIVGEDFQGQISLLPQAFDAERMFVTQIENKSGCAFVGLKRKHTERPIIDFAANSKVDLKIWGPGWSEHKIADYLVAGKLKNTELRQVYNAAKIVLNDHMPAMFRDGILSNRSFDALACGTAVISDNISWMPDEFYPFVTKVSTQEEFNEAVHTIMNESEEKQNDRFELALAMVDTHSFDARAREIIEMVNIHKPLK